MQYNLSLLLLSVFLVLSFADTEIRVVSPATLAGKFTEGVDNRPALFGVPKYGITLNGRVVYATPGDRDGCSPLNTSIVPNWPKSTETFITMVDRGDCSFVDKVRHAQNVGSTAVIIVDSEEETVLPYMADDGTGADITTPSVLISKADGDMIKDFGEDGGIVVLSMTWEVPHPDAHVEWTMWTSSYDVSAEEFKYAFSTIAELFKDSTTLTANYFFLDGASYGCTSYDGTYCGTLCTNQGRYCMSDPDHDTSDGVNGADVVRENLRQICAFQYANSTDIMLWWDYVTQFDAVCAHSGESYNEECSFAVIEEVGIPVTEIVECISNSGGYDDDSGENSIIEAQIRLRLDSEVHFLPTIKVNTAEYEGTYDCPVPASVDTCGVFSEICAGFAKGTLPDVCKTEAGCSIGERRDECGNCGGDGSFDSCGNCLSQSHPDRRDDPSLCHEVYASSQKGVHISTVVAIVFSAITLVACGAYYLHQRSQDSMRQELRGIIKEYAAVDVEDHDSLGLADEDADFKQPEEDSPYAN